MNTIYQPLENKANIKNMPSVAVRQHPLDYLDNIRRAGNSDTPQPHVDFIDGLISVFKYDWPFDMVLPDNTLLGKDGSLFFEWTFYPYFIRVNVKYEEHKTVLEVSSKRLREEFSSYDNVIERMEYNSSCIDWKYLWNKIEYYQTLFENNAREQKDFELDISGCDSVEDKQTDTSMFGYSDSVPKLFPPAIPGANRGVYRLNKMG